MKKILAVFLAMCLSWDAHAASRVVIVDGDGNEVSSTNPLEVSETAGASSPAKAEDAVHASGDVGTMVLGVRQSANAPLSGADGDYEPLQTDANGHLKVNLIDALPAGTNAIGKLSSNNGVDIGDVSVTDAVINTFPDNEPFNVAQINGVTPLMGNGATGTGALRVAQVNDGTGVLAGVTTVTTLTTLTGGGVAHDGADAGNPVKVGAKASSTLSDDTMVANADRTDATSDLDGAILIRDQFPLGDLISEAVSNTDGASTAFTNFSATASTRSYITGCQAFNSSATFGYVDFRDGTAGSVLYRMALPATGGSVLPASSTPYFRTTANTALAFDVSGALTTVYISCSGFKSKV